MQEVLMSAPACELEFFYSEAWVEKVCARTDSQLVEFAEGGHWLMRD
jgi:hypothetical protein